MHRKPLLWIAALALGALLGLSAQASAATVKGTVVHANKSAHTFVVAGSSGRLTKISSRHSARAGSVVRVNGRKLKNGDVRAGRMRVRGHARRARLRGLVTWSTARGFTVASNGTSLLVHRSSSDDPAPLGAPVSTNVTIGDNGDLDENECHQMGQPPDQMKLEGTVLSTDAAAETITISGDDDQAEAQSSDHGDDNGDNNDQNENENENEVQPAIVVHVPDATAFTVGDKVELIVSGPAADGSFTLIRVDEDNQGEDNGDNSGPGNNNQDNPGGNSGDNGSDG